MTGVSGALRRRFEKPKRSSRRLATRPGAQQSILMERPPRVRSFDRIVDSDALGNAQEETMERKPSDQLSGSPTRLGEPSPKHPPDTTRRQLSLGSAAVGAALSNGSLENSSAGAPTGTDRSRQRALGRSIRCSITVHPARGACGAPKVWECDTCGYLQDP